ncbi:hypothetical protein LCGC14_0072930 [marine sediment metagenome]|uniref:Uncharacterized protein n=1 Tax=marine sediment metagenome TaxID=412755 RepID=A0A0F9W082_9ZZZZ|nr:hypothetical protein [Halomonas sp.]HDZ48938.1 hypothetical protein [Halomonas sp.]HEB06316.1 hypothetical protein [Halomonas sp.]
MKHAPLYASLKTITAAVCTLAISAPLAAQEDIRINGEVIEMFNDLIIIEGDDRRLLVRPSEGVNRNISIGDDIIVEGRLDGDTLNASAMRQHDEETDVEETAANVIAPDVAAIQQQLTEREFGDMIELKRRQDAYRITSVNADGVDVRSYFSAQGDLLEWHIKRPGSDRPHRNDTLSDLAQDDIVNTLNEQGYANTTLVDFKGRHMEWLADNESDQQVILHVDYRGDVYREKRLPVWPGE